MARNKGKSKKGRKVQKQTPQHKKRKRLDIDVKLFNKWPAPEVRDQSLKEYINVEPRILPRSEGTLRGRFHKSQMHIVERLALKLMVSGHQGKKHRRTSGRFTGKYTNVMKAVENALDIVQKRTEKNPLEVLVRAVENAALREEVISYQLGSIVAREAVITAPQRRVDKTLRFFSQAAYRTAFRSKKSLENALADELVAACEGGDSFAVKEKERVEREAAGVR